MANEEISYEIKKLIGDTRGKRGASFEHDWNNTSLGVKNSDETEFVYTDLIGPRGLTGLSPQFLYNEEDEYLYVKYNEVSLDDYIKKVDIDTTITNSLSNSTTITDLVTQTMGNSYYTRTQTDNAITTQIQAIDFSPYALLANVNTQLNTKANSTDVYTKTETDAKIQAINNNLQDIINLING